MSGSQVRSRVFTLTEQVHEEKWLIQQHSLKNKDYKLLDYKLKVKKFVDHKIFSTLLDVLMMNYSSVVFVGWDLDCRRKKYLVVCQDCPPT